MLQVARSVVDGLLAEAARAAPEECCGLLLGAPVIVAILPAANVSAEPRSRFEIDPAALIAAHKAERAGGPRLAGYYHSHPKGQPVPSLADRALAAGEGRVWAIIGGGEVRFWRDVPWGFETLSYIAREG